MLLTNKHGTRLMYPTVVKYWSTHIRTDISSSSKKNLRIWAFYVGQMRGSSHLAQKHVA